MVLHEGLNALVVSYRDTPQSWGQGAGCDQRCVLLASAGFCCGCEGNE